MPGWVLLVPVVWIVLVFGYGALSRLQSGRPIAPRVPEGADFGETMASGRLAGGSVFRRANLNNCLVVWVARGRLRVDIAFPFGLFPMIGSSLVIDCPVASIARIRAIRRMWQPMLRFEFADADQPPVELVLRNEAGLLAALGRQPDEATRPLRAKTGRRFDLLFGRALTGVLGAGFLASGATGIASDIALRQRGIETPAVVEGFAGKTAILSYRFGGATYRIDSRFSGTWHQGEATTVIVLPDNPAMAVETGMLPFMVMFAAIGAVLLAFAFAGARMVPGWS